MYEVIILAMGPSRELCPFDCKDIYGVNTGYKQVYGEEWAKEKNGFITKLFLAHTQVRLGMREDDGLVHVKDIFNWEEMNSMSAELGFEMYNIHRVTGLKSKRYPLKRICEKFDTEYFSNAICYMLAYALDKATIGNKRDGTLRLRNPFKYRLYGVDMLEYNAQGGGEYQLEKGGVEFWLGYAWGLGCTTEITTASTLLTTVTRAPYGIKNYRLKDIDPYGLLKRKRFTDRELKQLEDYTRNQTTGFDFD